MKVLYIIFVFFVFSSSCKPIYYAPNTHNIPLLNRKNDLCIVGATSGFRRELQAAYAVDDHIGIMVNSMMMPKTRSNREDNFMKLNYYEGGAGYFNTISENVIWEVYGLAGYGTVMNYYHTNTAFYQAEGTINANMLKYSIQAAIGFRTDDIESAISVRVSDLHFQSISGDLTYNNKNQVDYLRQNSSHKLIEPAITLRAGGNILKLQLQAGKSFNMNTNDFKQVRDYITLGIVVRPFDTRYRGGDEKKK